MAFVKFIIDERSTKPKVVFQSSGEIHFNYAAEKILKIENFKYVVLYYDKDTRKVGIKFTNTNFEPIPIKIRRGGDYYIAGKDGELFFDCHSITQSSFVERYVLAYDSASGLYVFDLNEREI